MNIIALFSNVALFYIDIKYYKAILNKVDKGDTLKDLTYFFPLLDSKRKDLAIRDSIRQDSFRVRLSEYKTDENVNNGLK